MWAAAYDEEFAFGTERTVAMENVSVFSRPVVLEDRLNTKDVTGERMRIELHDNGIAAKNTWNIPAIVVNHILTRVDDGNWRQLLAVLSHCAYRLWGSCCGGVATRHRDSIQVTYVASVE